ncbi:styrene monooxygenase/indole monooxygenase family protein [Streptomyces sp. NPDC014733]|uniref:styrene monooxygenase/indole monooxygenase family protein n=1 Tax=Streptomyces sp. NPDC014733 TaxID=3364885 RepID=UPI0036F64872
MRKITIVGAGQAGLQLGIGLIDHGYDVTVVSNRTGEQIREGRVMSSQAMFGTALAHERDLGLDFWGDACPAIAGLGVNIADGQGGRALSFDARLDATARSIDQRVKMPLWMGEFARRGGRLEIREAGIADLERYAAESDLVIVAAGKGSIAGLFERDAQRSPFAAPQRALALTYVTGMTPLPHRTGVSFNVIPGVGEYFTMPSLTTTGPCDIMFFEGIPGGPLDRFDGLAPEQQLATFQELLRTYVPWEAERCTDLALTDAGGTLAGRFAPTVRRPVATLPSGAQVLGLADVLVLNDPVTGQGSNNASKCAASYLASILDHGDRPYDAAFMELAFGRFWDNAQSATAWTNAMLGAPPQHVLELFGAASVNPRVASRFVNGFDDPRDFFHWFMDPVAAQNYLASVSS